MEMKKFLGWAMAISLVIGVPALTAAVNGAGDTDTMDSDAMRGGGFGGATGMTNMTGTMGGGTMGAPGGSSLQREQGMSPTATGSTGTSTDSTTRTGRGSAGDSMGTRGGTTEMDSDTMRRGMRFHGMTGMRNMTGIEGGMMHRGGEME